MNVCSIKGCEREVFCTGWCGTHYNRWRRYGNPVHPDQRGHSYESYWPTDDRRPWESIYEWCRRLDSYGVA